MIIRNNRGEVIGEMNTTITKEGTVIRTNTIYNDGPSGAEHLHPRQSGQRSLGGCVREDPAVAQLKQFFVSGQGTASGHRKLFCRNWNVGR